jgi:hypothetical protein
MKTLLSILSLAFLSLTISQAEAAFSPVGLSLFPPVELPPSDFTVTGVRLNLVGSHQRVYGLDLGAIANITTQGNTGLQVAGLLNWNKGTETGVLLQAAGIANVNVNKVNLVGVQVALINYNQQESMIAGFQVGAVNLSSFTKMIGIEAGLYNTAHDVYGVQIGLVNVADHLHGVQIGLLNFNKQGLFAVAPILNIGF